VNHTLQDRRVFRVDRMSQVIEMRVFKLMCHKGAFRLVSEKTGLADNNIIVWFGGDKGGKKMAFKFGATVINCVKVNQTEAFDLISTMEAFNTYYNLKHGVFKHYTEELVFLFNNQEDPHLFVICNKDGSPLLVRSSEAAVNFDLFSSDPVQHTLEQCVLCMRHVAPKG
jgi:hypothetical protein